MTRKNFIQLAKVLRHNKPYDSGSVRLFWNMIVIHIANDLSRMYPKFKRDVFLEHCGFDSDNN